MQRPFVRRKSDLHTLLGRIFTADVLQRRGWENNYFCQLCFQNLETPSHLFTECPWSRQVWTALAAWSQLPSLLPSSWAGASSVSEWLQLCRLNTAMEKRKGAQSLVLLAAWEI
jgi:hypothetical protein